MTIAEVLISDTEACHLNDLHDLIEKVEREIKVLDELGKKLALEAISLKVMIVEMEERLAAAEKEAERAQERP